MLKPSDYGVVTSGDMAAFLVGAAAGGGLDAVLNVAGFAEPFVFAGICGAGTLGVKRFFDSLREQSEEKALKKNAPEQLPNKASGQRRKNSNKNSKLT